MKVAVRPPTRLDLIVVLTAFFALGLATAGCQVEEQTSITPLDRIPPLPQSSAANALSNLQWAYAERSIGEYAKLFAPDFVFVFVPMDLTPPHPTPVQWSLVDELASAGNMFRDSLVNRIELSSYVMGVPERLDSLSYGPRAWRVWVREANILVTARTTAVDSLTYIVDGATEAFYFREDPTRLARDGRPTWFIFRWEDQPIGLAKAENLSWGTLKVIFR